MWLLKVKLGTLHFDNRKSDLRSSQNWLDLTHLRLKDAKL
jgi:hypothetical protein